MNEDVYCTRFWIHEIVAYIRFNIDENVNYEFLVRKAYLSFSIFIVLLIIFTTSSKYIKVISLILDPEVSKIDR